MNPASPGVRCYLAAHGISLSLAFLGFHILHTLRFYPTTTTTTTYTYRTALIFLLVSYDYIHIPYSTTYYIPYVIAPTQ